MKRYSTIFLYFAGFSVLAQAPAVTIPFELFGDHIFVKAVVDNSEPLDMIFDSGSGVTVVDRDVAEKLEKVQHHITLNEGLVKAALIKHNTIAIGGYQMEKNIRVYSTDLSHLEISLGREFDGIVGYDFMHHHTIRINYNEQILEVYEPGEGSTLGEEIPIKLVNSIPVINGTVLLNNDEPHEGNFFLITGAGTTLDFNSPYAEKYDIIHKTGDHYKYLIKSISEVETYEYEGYIKTLTFGKQRIDNLPIGISQATTGIHSNPDVAGIIGNQILKMYNITYDYTNGVVYVMKNRHYGREFIVNCSGIDVQLSPDKQRVLIHQVHENSPASEQNIQQDAELVSLDGQNAMEMTLPGIKQYLKRVGETVELVIKENGKERTVSIVLKSLL